MNLSKQATYIYNILRDRQWHCPIEWDYADGHCKRITDINDFLKPQGLEVTGMTCTCGRHTSKIKMRRIIPISSKNEMANQFLKDFEVKEDVDKELNLLF